MTNQEKEREKSREVSAREILSDAFSLTKKTGVYSLRKTLRATKAAKGSRLGKATKRHVIRATHLASSIARDPQFWVDIANETNTALRRAGRSASQVTPDQIKKAVADSWGLAKHSPAVARERWNNMDKGTRVGVIAAMAGGAVVSIPFLVAMGPLSIVSALALLGGGAIASGGMGVAGGIIVTAGGAALSAAIAGTASSWVLSDPDVEALIGAYGQLEKSVKMNFRVMEKHKEKYRHLYKRYGEIATYVAQLNKGLQEGQGYDLGEVRANKLRSLDLAREIEELSVEDKETGPAGEAKEPHSSG